MGDVMRDPAMRFPVIMPDGRCYDTKEDYEAGNLSLNFTPGKVWYCSGALPPSLRAAPAAMPESLTELQATFEQARDAYRRAIRVHFPDGARVRVRHQEYAGQIIGEGLIVGMDLGGGLRVALGAAGVIRVVEWSELEMVKGEG